MKEKFDFLNIDCEGNDYNILKTINLKKFKPKIICIEVSKKNKKLIYKYLNTNHYKLLTTRFTFDFHNIQSDEPILRKLK